MCFEPVKGKVKGKHLYLDMKKAPKTTVFKAFPLVWVRRFELPAS